MKIEVGSETRKKVHIKGLRQFHLYYFKWISSSGLKAALAKSDEAGLPVCGRH